MLYRLLTTIRDGEVQSLLDIARTLDSSPDMVLQMVKELTNKGYLQEIGAGCDEPQTACPDCAVNGNCQVMARHWYLSEKGRAAISSTTKTK